MPENCMPMGPANGVGAIFALICLLSNWLEREPQEVRPASNQNNKMLGIGLGAMVMIAAIFIIKYLSEQERILSNKERLKKIHYAGQIPKEFLCGSTGKIMTDPVLIMPNEIVVDRSSLYNPERFNIIPFPKLKANIVEFVTKLENDIKKTDQVISLFATNKPSRESVGAGVADEKDGIIQSKFKST